jgi:hypothetical protein
MWLRRTRRHERPGRLARVRGRDRPGLVPRRRRPKGAPEKTRIHTYCIVVAFLRMAMRRKWLSAINMSLYPKPFVGAATAPRTPFAATAKWHHKPTTEKQPKKKEICPLSIYLSAAAAGILRRYCCAVPPDKRLFSTSAIPVTVTTLL